MSLFTHIFDLFYSVTNDYGLTIIAYTLLVRLAMLPLTIKQKKSMGKTKNLVNKTKLQSDNKQPKPSLAPLLLFVQAPIYIMMFRVFSTNVVSTGSFLLPWITNLSSPDPYYILPILYIIIQLMPNFLVSLDIIKNASVPKFSKSMIVLPVIMSVLFISKLPASLCLYMLTNNFASTLEKIFINV
ncbi:YidC/Oxa1 family membrane protein insertase [Proteinivorax tanatarense]|uniref:YidC/Oxa1 family membrane protein insertase n=1 Tax=Proteinivorax tanatarense TaxID=1260629 RepID=A0AAU7VJE0_9FIRM